MQRMNGIVGTKIHATSTVVAAAACFLFLSPAWSQTTKSTDSACKADPKSAACTNANGNTSQSSGSNSAPSKSLHDEFPFPTEDSKRGGDTTTPSPSNNGLPSMPTDPVPDPPASSEKPINPPPSAGGSSSSSSSDDGDSATGKPSDPDEDVAPTTAAPNAPVKARALKDLGSRGDSTAARAKLEKTRVADDLKVAKFYLNDGNNQGAYMRYKDAVEHDPEDPDARFGLAETANKLNKHDEAVLNYREYLNLDGGGDHDRATRQALAKLGAPVK